MASTPAGLEKRKAIRIIPVRQITSLILKYFPFKNLNFEIQFLVQTDAVWFLHEVNSLFKFGELFFLEDVY